MIMKIMEFQTMQRIHTKKIPYKEVWGHYRLGYGPTPGCITSRCKDWFDPDEDDEEEDTSGY